MTPLCSRLIAALVIALSLFGCQIADDRETATQQATTTTTNPDFAALAASVRDVRVAQSARILAMSPAARAAYLNELVELRPALDGGGQAELDRFTALTGITVSQLDALRKQTLAYKQSSSDDAGGPSGPALSDLPALDAKDSMDGMSGGGDVSDCIDECNDAYDDTALLAELIYIKENFACILAAPAISPIGTLLCGAAALAQLASTMVIADKNRDDCIDICNGENPDGECSDDADCPASEYCWKGPAGLGDNECRDKKELGQVCSRDGKCESGCCKYDFFVHPFSFTCQPAQDCN